MELAYIDVRNIPAPKWDYGQIMRKMLRTGKGVKIKGEDVGLIQARIHAAMRRHMPDGMCLRTTRNDGYLWAWLEKEKKA